jgi:cation transport regulator ChaB
MRIPLRDGQWAELRDRITHGQDKEIKRARVRVQQNAEAVVDWSTIITRAFIVAWDVKDTDGNPIDLNDEDALDRAPNDIIDVLFPHAVSQYKATTDPNPDTPS